MARDSKYDILFDEVKVRFLLSTDIAAGSPARPLMTQSGPGHSKGQTIRWAALRVLSAPLVEAVEARGVVVNDLPLVHFRDAVEGAVDHGLGVWKGSLVMGVIAAP